MFHFVILCLALQQKIDMSEVLKYPLTPVPLAFCHYDGSFRDTPKSKLSKHLRESIESSQPSYIDAIIIDGNFYFYLLADLPVTFGGISRKILVKLCNLKAPRIDIIFDQIKTPSIKDYERDQRSKANDRSLNYQISGPLQTRPPKFKDALRNDQFKDSLIQFLVNSWEDDSFADIISYKLIYVTYREKCFCFSSSEGNVYKNEVVSLCSSHEEADSQIFFHLHSMSDESNVVIRSNDADVLVIAIGQARVLKSDVWIEHGFTSDNSLAYVHVNSVINFLGMELSEAMPGFHSFTGCDYTPAFSGRGKLGPPKILQQHKDIQQAFISIGKEDDVSDEVVLQLEKFVCKMYGCRNSGSVDEARQKQFFRTYKPKRNKPVLSAKGISSISMPPCSKVLYQQILRVHLISATWLKSYKADPPSISPTDSGFEIVNEKCYPKWHDGDITPSSIDCISNNANEDEDDEILSHEDDEDDLADAESDDELFADIWYL